MDDEVLHVLYLDRRRTIDHQHERLRHIRDRAGVLLATTVGSAILLWPEPDDWSALDLVGLMGFLVAVAAGCTIMLPVRFRDVRMQLTTLDGWRVDQTRSEFATSLIQTTRRRLATSEQVVRARNALLRSQAVSLVLHVSAAGSATTF